MRDNLNTIQLVAKKPKLSALASKIMTVTNGRNSNGSLIFIQKDNCFTKSIQEFVKRTACVTHGKQNYKSTNKTTNFKRSLHGLTKIRHSFCALVACLNVQR